jgi:hypothetical protein
MCFQLAFVVETKNKTCSLWDWQWIWHWIQTTFEFQSVELQTVMAKTLNRDICGDEFYGERVFRTGTYVTYTVADQPSGATGSKG